MDRVGEDNVLQAPAFRAPTVHGECDLRRALGMDQRHPVAQTLLDVVFVNANFGLVTTCQIEPHPWWKRRCRQKGRGLHVAQVT